MAMVAPVIIFDYFGVLARGYGQIDTEMMSFVSGNLAGRFKLAVLSNMNSGDALGMLGDYATMFKEVMISGELGVAKPDERAFLLAAQKLGEFPEVCTMIDDSEQNCAAAEGVGMRAIHYKDLGQFKQEIAKYGILTS